MPAFQYAIAFQTFTPTVTTGASQADYPIARVADPDTPNRMWRSTTTGQQVITCDMGSSKSIQAAVLHYTGDASVDLSFNNGGAYSTFTVNKDTLDGYRKLFVAQSFTQQNFLVRFPNATPADGNSFHQLGTIFLIPSILTANFNPSALSIVPDQSIIRNEIGSRIESLPNGDKFLRFRLRRDDMDESQMADWYTLGSMGEHEPLIFFLNDGNTQRVYYVSREDKPQYDYDGALINTSLSWRQKV